MQKLKSQFDTYLQVYNVKSIPIQQLSLILKNHFNERASLLSQILSKSNHNLVSQQITWDNLLEFLYNQIYLKDHVAKINKSKFSITQVTFDVVNKYQDILKYVLKNQTNNIRKIVKTQMSLKQVLLIHLDSQIIIYDKEQKKFINYLQYHYMKTQTKILQKNKKKKQYAKQMKRASQQLDQVKPISTSYKFFDQHKNQSEEKRSLMRSRGGLQSNSVISSALSIKKRTNTDVSQLFRKMPKKTHSVNLKYKNTDTDKIFKIFQDATLQNSIQIARSFVQSKQSFKSHMQVQKSWLVVQSHEDIKQLNKAQEKHNFYKQINQMKQYSNFLDKTRKNQIGVTYQNKNRNFNLSKHKKGQTQLKSDQKGNYNHFQAKTIQIQCFSSYQNYILVGLHSRQIRLYQYKRFVQIYKEQCIFDKSYDYLPINVILYKSQVRKLFNMAVFLTYEGTTKIIITQLSYDMKPAGQSFKTTLQFTPMCQCNLPLGFVTYNQKGFISVFQLNSPLNYTSERKLFQKCFKDPNQNNPICINCVKMHQNGFQFYLGSKDGKIYCLDKYKQSIRIHNKVAQNRIISMIFLNNYEDMLIYLDNFQIMIINPKNLQVQFSIQPNQDLLRSNLRLGKLINNIILLQPQNLRYGIYSQRGFQTFHITHNFQKKFNNEKPIKMFNSRQKILQRKKTQSITLQNDTLQKIQKKLSHNKNYVNKQVKISQSFIRDFYLAMLGENYQIQIFNKQLEYIGSYHNLQLNNLVEIDVNNQLKFLAIYYEAGDIQVINIYSQQIILNVYYPNDVIHSLFFGQSSQHFLGLTTNKNMTLLYSQSQKQQKNNLKLNLQYYHSINDSFAKQPELKTKSKQIKTKFFRGKLISWKSILFLHQENQVNFLTVHHQKSYQRNFSISLDFNILKDLKNSQYIKVSEMKSIFEENSLVCSLNNFVIIKIHLSTKVVQKIFTLNNQDISIYSKFLDFNINNSIILYEKAKQEKQNENKAAKLLRKNSQPPKSYFHIQSFNNQHLRTIGSIQEKNNYTVDCIGQYIILKGQKYFHVYSQKGKFVKTLKIQNISQ